MKTRNVFGCFRMFANATRRRAAIGLLLLVPLLSPICRTFFVHGARNTAALSLGIRERNHLELLEGARSSTSAQGVAYTLKNGVVIPPLSQKAIADARALFPSADKAALDRRFNYLITQTPFAPTIAAEIEQGNLSEFVREKRRFDTDRFFVSVLVPRFLEACRAADVHPGDALWLLEHALLTQRAPLVRGADSDTGVVGSFREDETALTLYQFAARRLDRGPTWMSDIVRLALLRRASSERIQRGYRGASSVELATRAMIVTYGSEEGPVLHAFSVLKLRTLYKARVVRAAEAVVASERRKRELRMRLVSALNAFADRNNRELLEWFSVERNWRALGLDDTLTARAARRVNGSTLLGVYVSRFEKLGYPLEESYRRGRAILIDFAANGVGLERRMLVRTLVKDQAFHDEFWRAFAHDHRGVTTEVEALAWQLSEYRDEAEKGVSAEDELYNAMVDEREDIGVEPLVKQAVGFHAHLSDLVAEEFQPNDRDDPRYRRFARTVSAYLREAPDISATGGVDAPLKIFGLEGIPSPDVFAPSADSAPRLRALGRLYRGLRASGELSEWDAERFALLLSFAAHVASGWEPDSLPQPLLDVAPLAQRHYRQLIAVVGPEGLMTAATLYGVQQHDYRLAGHPVASARSGSRSGCESLRVMLTRRMILDNGVRVGVGSLSFEDGKGECTVQLGPETTLFIPGRLGFTPVSRAEEASAMIRESFELEVRLLYGE